MTTTFRIGSSIKKKLRGSVSLRVRLLPIVIGCASVMLITRLYDIKVLLEGGEQLFGIVELNAEPPESINELDSQTLDTNQGGERIIPPTSLTQEVRNSDKSFDPLNLTAEEVRVLEKLSERRQELDKREANLEERQQVLLSLEQRINSKVRELQELKKSIEAIVNYHDKEEAAKLAKLVKIYEVMKPKEAAKLFSKMNLGVLIEVLGQMKEAKAASVMGKMDPQVARIVTEELARRQEITDEARAQVMG